MLIELSVVIILSIILGGVIGNAISRLDAKSKIIKLETELEAEKKLREEKIATLEDAEKRLKESFTALSSEALKSNNNSFLELARAKLGEIQTKAQGELALRKKEVENLVQPINNSLEKFNKQITEIEKGREGAYQGLLAQITELKQTQINLQTETANLVTALRKPNVRGRWGEIQLRKVVELAGMVAYCDFQEQLVQNSDEGRIKPDLIVKLPGEKIIVVDAKTPLDAYLNAIEAKEDDNRFSFLQTHARQVKSHIAQLSKKSYWDQFESTPDMVVLFIPGESFLSSALEIDHGLLEDAIAQKVLLATPMTLIALLKSVAYGWQQEKLAQSSQEIANLGKELYDRISTMVEHYAKVGKNLNSAVDAYNKSVSSIESRVLVSARKFTDLGVSSKKEIGAIDQIEKSTRVIALSDVD